MDPEKIAENLTEEEREMFLNADCTSCYEFVKKGEVFSALIQKNINREKLTDEEWEYILFRLYILSCKALVEEQGVDFMDRILSFLSKIGMKISKQDKPLYNECLKMVEFVSSFRKEKEINVDVRDSFYETQDSKSPTDLDILLHQYEEADLFRKSRNAFMEAYKGSEYGQLSIHERMYIRAFQNAYLREKELVKRRNESNA